MTATPTDRLETSGLELWRGDRCLFKNVALGVQSGQLLHVQGANGSGKTSLLRVLCGLSLAEEGEVRWNGQTTTKCRYEFHQAVAYVGHEDGLHDDLTALENLVWGVGLKSDLGKDQVRAKLDDMGLAGLSEILCFALSAGQRRRLALARVMLSGARLWVLDEPLANLDREARRWCVERIGRHVASGGLAIMTSHQSIDLDGGETLTLDLDS